MAREQGHNPGRRGAAPWGAGAGEGGGGSLRGSGLKFPLLDATSVLVWILAPPSWANHHTLLSLIFSELQNGDVVCWGNIRCRSDTQEGLNTYWSPLLPRPAISSSFEHVALSPLEGWGGGVSRSSWEGRQRAGEASGSPHSGCLSGC